MRVYRTSDINNLCGNLFKRTVRLIRNMNKHFVNCLSRYLMMMQERAQAKIWKQLVGKLSVFKVLTLEQTFGPVDFFPFSVSSTFHRCTKNNSKELRKILKRNKTSSWPYLVSILQVSWCLIYTWIQDRICLEAITEFELDVYISKLSVISTPRQKMHSLSYMV